MSDDTLRRLLGTLDEAADPSPQFRESLYATLERQVTFGTEVGGSVSGFRARRRSVRWGLLVALALALALAFGAAFVALQQKQASACDSGTFAVVRQALAAVPAYDYTITGPIDVAASEGGQTAHEQLNVDGRYRAPDRMQITFAPGTKSVNIIGSGSILQSITWIGNRAFGITYPEYDQTGTPRWRAIEDPWFQGTRDPDFVSRSPTDPVSFQLAGSTDLPTIVTWARSGGDPGTADAPCSFDATIRPAGNASQTLHVVIDSQNRPVEIRETRQGFRWIDGADRNQDLTTAISYPSTPSPVDAPSGQDLATPFPLPSGFTFPPVLPRSPQVIQVGETATLTDAAGSPTQEITAVELRTVKADDQGRAAPPGFVFLELHVRIHALVRLYPAPNLYNDILSRSGHYRASSFELSTMQGAPQPALAPRLQIAAGETVDGWASALVPDTGDVRYRVMADNNNPYTEIPMLEIVLRP